MPEQHQAQRLPVTLGNEYQGFVDYILLKQEMARMSTEEVTAADGMRLTLALVLNYLSIRRGYKNYRWLEAALGEQAAAGKSVLLSAGDNDFTVSVRQ